MSLFKFRMFFEQSIGSIQDIAVTDMAPDANIMRISAQCRQVIEEPTKRGFRVKLII
jgi:hypothetical protein